MTAIISTIQAYLKLLFDGVTDNANAFKTIEEIHLFNSRKFSDPSGIALEKRIGLSVDIEREHALAGNMVMKKCHGTNPAKNYGSPPDDNLSNLRHANGVMGHMLFLTFVSMRYVFVTILRVDA
jgi:hypothetical protein